VENHVGRQDASLTENNQDKERRRDQNKEDAWHICNKKVQIDVENAYWIMLVSFPDTETDDSESYDTHRQTTHNPIPSRS